jgi:hypothetical protein
MANNKSQKLFILEILFDPAKVSHPLSVSGRPDPGEPRQRFKGLKF